MVSNAEDGTFRVWNLIDGVLLLTLVTPLTPPARITAIVMTPDGARVLSNTEDGALQVWNLTTMMLLFTLVEHTGPITAFPVLSDGRALHRKIKRSAYGI